MKTILFICCCLLTLAFPAFGQQEEQLKVWVEDTEIYKSDVRESSFVIKESDVTDYTSFNFTLEVPSGVKLTSLSVPERLKNHIVLSSMADGNTDIKVICYNPENLSFQQNAEDETLCTINFSVEDNMNGNYNIYLTDIVFNSNTDGVIKSHTLNWQTSTLVVNANGSPSADLNNDDKTDAVDLGILINYVLSSDSTGDINDDGKTDAVDIGAMKDIILGK